MARTLIICGMALASHKSTHTHTHTHTCARACARAQTVRCLSKSHHHVLGHAVPGHWNDAVLGHPPLLLGIDEALPDFTKLLRVVQRRLRKEGGREGGYALD